MRALSGPVFDVPTLLALSEDHHAKQRRVGLQHVRHRLIIGLWLVATPVATLAWVAGLAWAAISLVELAMT
jgi:hypothetical protein